MKLTKSDFTNSFRLLNEIKLIKNDENDGNYLRQMLNQCCSLTQANKIKNKHHFINLSNILNKIVSKKNELNGLKTMMIEKNITENDDIKMETIDNALTNMDKLYNEYKINEIKLNESIEIDLKKEFENTQNNKEIWNDFISIYRKYIEKEYELDNELNKSDENENIVNEFK